jgi:hypothetical protein
MSYPLEKIHDAVLSLAGGSGPVQERLWASYCDCLIRLEGPTEYPTAELKKRTVALMKRIDTEEKCHDLDDFEVSKVVEELVSLLIQLSIVDDKSLP